MLLYLHTKPERSSFLSLCGDVGFSSQSSTTREHRLCQRLEPEVQEGHFTSKIRMKQRLKSSYCAKNGNRQERRMVGAKNRLTGELSGVTCPEKKDFNAFLKRQFKKENNDDKSYTVMTALDRISMQRESILYFCFTLLRASVYHIKCNLSIQITLLHLWPLLPSTSL